MTPTIRILLLLEAATFVLASLIHSGWLVAGYQHHQARIAEGVIAVWSGCSRSWQVSARAQCRTSYITSASSSCLRWDCA
jgi:hypothetical protein